MFPGSTRLQLGLLVAAVGAAVQLAARGPRTVFGAPVEVVTNRDRGWVAGVRVGAATVGLASLAPVLGAQSSRWVLGATALGIVAPVVALGVARWRAARRHRVLPSEWPWLASAPLHLLNAATIALGAILFAWMLPRLPSIVPLHVALFGSDGYGSPATLWWSLLPLTLVTAALWIASWLLADEACPRRLALLRFVETLLVGCDVAIVVVWLGAAASGRPGLPLLRPALLVAGAVVAAALITAFGIGALTRRCASEVDDAARGAQVRSGRRA